MLLLQPLGEAADRQRGVLLLSCCLFGGLQGGLRAAAGVRCPTAANPESRRHSDILQEGTYRGRQYPSPGMCLSTGVLMLLVCCSSSSSSSSGSRSTRATCASDAVSRMHACSILPRKSSELGWVVCLPPHRPCLSVIAVSIFHRSSVQPVVAAMQGRAAP